MRLVQVLYSPEKCFSEIGPGDWQLPLSAIAVIFLISLSLQFLLVVLRLSAKFGSGLSILSFLGAFVLFVGNLLVYASVSWWVLNLVRGPPNYGVVLSVISYAAYVRELARLFMTISVAGYHIATGSPLTTGIAVRTDATIFLDKAIATGRLHSLASSLDIMTSGFIILVAFGFNASILRVRWSEAYVASSIPWAAWTLVKLAMADGRLEFLFR